MILPDPETILELQTISVYGKVSRIIGLVVEGHCPPSTIGSFCEITPANGGKTCAGGNSRL